ncbi:citrate lyase subunit alpha, partial [Rhizobium giardinii]|uniref:citrate lyase subunit alpha n=1 Tax=Rhizobium giardinii TaxID=56731 RepID=UPI0023EA6279
MAFPVELRGNDSKAGQQRLQGLCTTAFDPSSNVATGEMLATRIASGTPELLENVDEILSACSLRDGATLSFHHHLRDGDAVLNHVLDSAARSGLKGLTIAASSIFPVHAPLVEHIANGVVGRIVCDYVKGPVASAIMEGMLPQPAVLQTHGGRARAISSGQLIIDAAFLGAPRVNRDGSASGAGGRASCGPLG